MKRIRIFFSSSDECVAEGVQEFDGPDVQIDFLQMETHYRRMKPHLFKQVEQIKEYWETEGEQRLFDPKARIALMTRGKAENMFGEVAFGESVEFVASLTWSIGDALEIESVEWMQKRESMKGLLLDVTGSLCLYEMHSALLDWIGVSVAASMGLSVIEQFYPGIDACNSGVIERMQENMGTDHYIGVRLHGDMLYPRKAQCSFVMIGEGLSNPLKRYIPCNPCHGSRCLYWQLGGCHMDTIVSVLGEEEKRIG